MSRSSSRTGTNRVIEGRLGQTVPPEGAQGLGSEAANDRFSVGGSLDRVPAHMGRDIRAGQHHHTINLGIHSLVGKARADPVDQFVPKRIAGAYVSTGYEIVDPQPDELGIVEDETRDVVDALGRGGN